MIDDSDLQRLVGSVNGPCRDYRMVISIKKTQCPLAKYHLLQLIITSTTEGKRGIEAHQNHPLRPISSSILTALFYLEGGR